jgi:predicted nucleotidyltransferase
MNGKEGVESMQEFHYLSGMNLKDSIRNNSSEFISICKGHDVRELYAFGSSTNEYFKEDSSDIDLLVELKTQDPIKRGENLMDLWEKFENFFHRRVDLLTSSSIKNPILRNSIDSSKILIYDGQEQKVSF